MSPTLEAMTTHVSTARDNKRFLTNTVTIDMTKIQKLSEGVNFNVVFAIIVWHVIIYENWFKCLNNVYF